MKILLGKKFINEFPNFPEKDQEIISSFIEHVKDQGFMNLEGRNKSSDNLDYEDPDYVTKSEYAKSNQLWHYHIGIKCYDMSKPFGDRTSQYVLHYSKKSDNEIGIVDYGSHPPFLLPSSSYLELDNN